MNWIVFWVLVAVFIWPLRSVERWMHKHIQGLGLLLTNNAQAAVLIYYLLLLPGVVLHEGSQWVLAQILRVKVKKFQLWPEKQKGSIRLGMVEIDEKSTDEFRASLIGMIPVVTGVALIALIGATRFNVSILGTAFSTGDLPTILSGIGAFMSTPDFWLWVYLIFAVANAMMPEEIDSINWWILIIPFGVVMLVIALIQSGFLGSKGVLFDFGYLIKASFEVPILMIGQWLSLALGMALGVDLLVMVVIAAMEAIFSRVLDRELEYS
jgi:hypothetical protein